MIQILLPDSKFLVTFLLKVSVMFHTNAPKMSQEMLEKLF